MDRDRAALSASSQNSVASSQMSCLATGYWLLVTVPLAFLAVFYFYPLAAIMQRSFAPDGVWDWGGIARVTETTYFARVLGFTLGQAALSTVLTLAVGLPATYFFARWEFRGQSFLRALTTVPFLLPTIVVAFAFSALLGPRGWINIVLMEWFALDEPPLQLVGTLALILIAHVYYNLSLVIRIVGGFWANLDPQLAQAARVLGANRWRAFVTVTLPLLAPAIVAAALLIFVFDFTSFGVVLILGGPRLATLEVEIYRQTVNLFDLPVAATLSLVQLVVTFVLMALYARLQSRLSRPLRLRPQRITRRRPRTLRERGMVWLTMGALVVFIAAPLVTLVAQSFVTPDGFALTYYAALFVNARDSIAFVPPIEAARNSFVFAVLTMALALPLGYLAAQSLVARPPSSAIGHRLSAIRHHALDPIFMLPLATSSVTLGFGFILALGQPPLNLRASVWLVPIAHA
ncbi:MAG: iron ABC transporter permease, partial [Chloroflexota bacterium]